MYKGYRVSEQEVVWLSILECCSLPYARLKLPVEVFECLGCSSPHQRETGGNIWAFGEGGTSQEWSVLCVDFTVQKQNLITCCSLCSFSQKEASSSSGVMNIRFIHIESTTSVRLSLPPFYRLVLSHLFFSFLCGRCDCWVSSTGDWQPTGLHNASLHKSTNSWASVFGPCQQSGAQALFRGGAMFNQWLVCVLCFRAVSTVHLVQ